MTVCSFACLTSVYISVPSSLDWLSQEITPLKYNACLSTTLYCKLCNHSKETNQKNYISGRALAIVIFLKHFFVYLLCFLMVFCIFNSYRETSNGSCV
ncbi:hypothetical protein FKM82_023865 [Ascaphus truei]